jgi:hypothetical protein
MAKYTILFVFLMGCTNLVPSAPLPNQGKAVGLVWTDVYQEKNDAPSINWIETLNCHDMDGYYKGEYPTAIADSGRCIGGAYWGYENWIDLAHNSNVFSETSISHELLHAHLEHLYGDGDGGHIRPEWGGSQGRPENLWDYAQQTLVANEL